MKADDSRGLLLLDDERDPAVTRIHELGRATQGVQPVPGFAVRVLARIDDRVLRRQARFVLAAAGIMTLVGVVFWWRADVHLTAALVTAYTEGEGIEP